MPSSSTTERPARRPLPSGTRVAGFRVEGVLRQTPAAVLYEATQLSLGRRVALKLVNDPDADPHVAAASARQARMSHPGVAPVYETGSSEHGTYVALRLARGPTLADELDGGRLDGRRAERVLSSLEAALAAAHAAGLAHGSLTAADVVVAEGDVAQLLDFPAGGDQSGLPAAVRGDRAALARLRTSVQAAAARHSDGRRRRAPVVAGLAAIAAVSVAVALPGRPSEDPAPAEAAPPPAPAPGALRLGSHLGPGPAERFDCLGARPDSGSPDCTLMPLDVRGRPLSAPAAGVVRRWAVRGAEGTLAIQVVRPAGEGAWREVRRSQYVAVDGPAPRAFDADVPVRRGDRLAIELQPGSAVGVRARAGAAAWRWRGPLDAMRAPRPPDAQPVGAGQLLVRFDIVRGAAPRSVPVLTGSRAVRAPAGRVVEVEPVELAGGAPGSVAVVRLDGEITVDLRSGGRRLVRIAVPDAHVGGRLVGLEQGAPDRALLRLRWRNPGAAPVLVHDFVVDGRSLRMVN